SGSGGVVNVVAPGSVVYVGIEKVSPPATLAWKTSYTSCPAGVTASLAGDHLRLYGVLRVGPPAGPGMHVVADSSPAKTGGVRSATSTTRAETRQLLRSSTSTTRWAASEQARTR